ncbi:DNA-binding domain-containing protein [Pandoraea sp.]|uniref:HvfC/BufC N-terminal domain-containing protein n=1 Tax=Pandoraea sp. TaxID=1883445 RepID=UPI00121A0CAA|nr:DNA-binding domain-containing protein [Pandoraea sp.]TAL53010.1 MAG: DUF2063 domain-containing protein [Pandoraea sp.]TAM18750.1 MAG: DUF2063 domain-containing protein [Pandoraea sp.]
MRPASALLELQLSFLTALYDSGEAGPTERLSDSGLEPAARLRIYRHNSEQIHLDALRTTFPAVHALVGDTFFEQTAARYRGAHPSRSGNLQAFGEHFAGFLATQADTHRLPYLSDVAQLEWRRQNAALAGDAEALSLATLGAALANVDGPMRVSFHPSMQRMASPHPILTLWQYAMRPSAQRLTLPESGEHVVLWRSADEVAMARVDAASFACIDALSCGEILDAAHAAASAQDPDFDLAACITSLVQEGLVTAITPV